MFKNDLIIVFMHPFASNNAPIIIKVDFTISLNLR
jgi:hypothetical protein